MSNSAAFISAHFVANLAPAISSSGQFTHLLHLHTMATTFSHAFTTATPFTDTLLALLDFRTTLSLSLTSRKIASHINSSPHAYTHLDLSDRASSALRRLIDSDRNHLHSGTYGLRDFLTRFHYATYDTPHHIRVVLPEMALRTFVLGRGARVKTLRLDGVRVESELLKNVLQTAHETLEVLEYVFTLGCTFVEFVEMLKEVEMSRLKELRVCLSWP
ncbi:hypothetical protein K440DRAFT_668946 [Wilcoxina mikolae CBS 423.85]|nr:hypothetical protein K440DRAFT_668946 [Wilcoxina mikolae CBS 423.85]